MNIQPAGVMAYAFNPNTLAGRKERRMEVRRKEGRAGEMVGGRKRASSVGRILGYHSGSLESQHLGGDLKAGSGIQDVWDT